MCGRFTQQRPTAELADLFDAELRADDLGPRFNIAPTDPAAVIVERRDRRRAVTAYAWGLIPHWSDDPRIAARTFNARAETIATSRAFRESFERRRCIVPVDGFYEWRRDESGRHPYLVHRADGAPLALAGLWAGWRDPQTDTVRRTFSIVTTEPNELLAPLHNRMPVVLDREDWVRWLDPSSVDLGELHGLLRPAQVDGLDVYAVRPLVNNVRNDGPELIVPMPA